MIIEWGQAQMTIEMIAIVGFAFVATTIAALLHEYRTDVLHGPYIEGLDRRSNVVIRHWALAPVIADRFRWRARNIIYLTSIIAC
jgi:hypothetical protein